jgi:glycosyltransferase involved in cell wall biosynthesis
MKVSIVTTCMGRLHHLRETMSRNWYDALHDSENYSTTEMDENGDPKDWLDFEFVLVNYNSPDGMDKWVEQEYGGKGGPIDHGMVIHVHDQSATEYSMARSRNIGFKVATGDVVVQVDCDNFIKKGFVARCADIARVTAGPVVMFRANHRLRGRLGFRRLEFIDLLGGYDERFVGYGADDRDLFERAKALGFTPVTYGGDLSQFECLDHPAADSIRFMAEKSRRHTEHLNKALHAEAMAAKRYKANQGVPWGSGRVLVNFEKEVLL